jgi:aminopeptidase-like protein
MNGTVDATTFEHWMDELWSFPRSLTGIGVQKTLSWLEDHIGPLHIHKEPTGSQVMDWTVPPVWEVGHATLHGPDGSCLADWSTQRLSLLGYSQPFQGVVDLETLQNHLYSLPEQPDAVPYVTSYYAPRWGFCIDHHTRDSLLPGAYTVDIQTRFSQGALLWGEWVLPGATQDEVLLSTYICHPDMANNELSGPLVCTAIAQWLRAQPRRKTYRLVFVPETIGSLAFLAKRLPHLQRHLKAGYVVTCVGDNRGWGLVPGRNETAAERVAARRFDAEGIPYTPWRWMDRGSDERQYCAPGIDLPVASVVRSRYGTYPEYHTSLDNRNLVTGANLLESTRFYQRILEDLDSADFPQTLVLGEPQMGRRGLYPTISAKGSAAGVRGTMDILSLCDGRTETQHIAQQVGCSLEKVEQTVALLRSNGVLAPI